jgi:hypothetical protein
MYQATEKCPSREHHCSASNFGSVGQSNGLQATIGHHKFGNLTFDNVKVSLIGNKILDCLAIELAIRLSSRTTDSRTLTPVQQPELNAGCIGSPAHYAIQRIDLADELAFAYAPDGRIAGHRADRVGAHGDQGSSRAGAGRRGRGFTTGVPASDNDDIKLHRAHDTPCIRRPSNPVKHCEQVSRETVRPSVFHVNHLPMQN